MLIYAYRTLVLLLPRATMSQPAVSTRPWVHTAGAYQLISVYLQIQYCLTFALIRYTRPSHANLSILCHIVFVFMDLRASRSRPGSALLKMDRISFWPRDIKDYLAPRHLPTDEGRTKDLRSLIIQRLWCNMPITYSWRWRCYAERRTRPIR